MSNAADVLQALRTACDAAGSQKAWALANGFHPSFVTDVLKGRRDVTERLANALEYEFVQSYKRRTPTGYRRKTGSDTKT